MSKKLVLVDWAECPNCGDTAEIQTDEHNPTGLFNEDDVAHCCECAWRGSVRINEGTAEIQWAEDNE